MDDHLKIKIQDNGCGFQPPERLGSYAVKGKLGMIGIEQRIQSIGGTLNIHSRPGYGTTLLVEVKYSQ
jgi:signal transduction histidine kinase